MKNLLVIGIFFVHVKFISTFFKMQAQVFLSHIGNGGLMQAWRLPKELQQTENIENQEEWTLDTPISNLEDLIICHYTASRGASVMEVTTCS